MGKSSRRKSFSASITACVAPGGQSSFDRSRHRTDGQSRRRHRSRLQRRRACRASAVTPSFDCRAATYPDEKTICGNPEWLGSTVWSSRFTRTCSPVRGHAIAKNISEPLLEQRQCVRHRLRLHQANADDGDRRSSGAPRLLQPPETMEAASQVGPVYAIDNIRLGSSVSATQNFRGFDCAPSQQYTGPHRLQRRASERSLRRRTSVSTSLLQAADGSVVYVGQKPRSGVRRQR